MTNRVDAGHTRCLHPMDENTKAECAAQTVAFDAMLAHLGMAPTKTRRRRT